MYKGNNVWSACVYKGNNVWNVRRPIFRGWWFQCGEGREEEKGNHFHAKNVKPRWKEKSKRRPNQTVKNGKKRRIFSAAFMKSWIAWLGYFVIKKKNCTLPKLKNLNTFMNFYKAFRRKNVNLAYYVFSSLSLSFVRSMRLKAHSSGFYVL